MFDPASIKTPDPETCMDDFRLLGMLFDSPIVLKVSEYTSYNLQCAINELQFKLEELAKHGD